MVLPECANRSVIVGIDTGGTFTDFVAFVDGEIHTHKVLSTPSDPAAAVLRGLQEIVPPGRAAIITYGSTVATNALIERRGARVALLTTAGFEDVIEIGRQNRPDLYALEPRRPAPLVTRAMRVGVRERMLYDGRALLPLTAAAVGMALRALRRQHPEAVAVCFLHSYANARHERAIGKVLSTQVGLFVSLSHQLVPEYREYERVSTTVMNAYVGPLMSRHLRALQEGLAAHTLRVMQSNGGAISTQVAAREAVRTLLSGPAAGVSGAVAVARSLKLPHAITFDMGGTSTDVSLLDGQARLQTNWEIGGLPLKVPAIDIHTVGAGGGSIAYVDVGGALKVGPRSAGADPGPACYGHGKEPTVTDANLLLGRLVQGGFLGGRMALDRERSRAVVSRLSRKLGVSVDAAAEGIVRVANAGMERAIRTISVERGHDPRAYSLIVFGGAGGQHACELAMSLGITHVVIPCHPGLLSAWGAAAADVRRDYVRSLRQVAPSAAQLRAGFVELERAARRDFSATDRCRVLRSLDIRYVGQGHELNLPFTASYARAFHAAHKAEFGYCDDKRDIEVVNLRIGVTTRGARVPAHARAELRPSLSPTQPVLWRGSWRQAKVHDRGELRAGRVLNGPALVCEFSATTFVAPGWSLRVDPKTQHLELRHER